MERAITVKPADVSLAGTLTLPLEKEAKGKCLRT